MKPQPNFTYLLIIGCLIVLVIGVIVVRNVGERVQGSSAIQMSSHHWPVRKKNAICDTEYYDNNPIVKCERPACMTGEYGMGVDSAGIILQCYEYIPFYPFYNNGD